LSWRYPSAKADTLKNLQDIIKGVLTVGVFADEADIEAAYAACTSCMQEKAAATASYYARRGVAVAVLMDLGRIVARCLVWGGHRAPKAYGGHRAPKAYGEKAVALLAVLDASGLTPQTLDCDRDTYEVSRVVPGESRERVSFTAPVGYRRYDNATLRWVTHVQWVEVSTHPGTVKPGARFRPHTIHTVTDWCPYVDRLEHTNSQPRTEGL
jgi:hypothetical protein